MEQLERCQTEYFDFYLVHSLDRYKYEICEKYHVYDALKRFRSEGRIRHLGFSFHDTPEILEKIVSDHAWDFAQIQLNYLDRKTHSAKPQQGNLLRNFRKFSVLHCPPLLYKSCETCSIIFLKQGAQSIPNIIFSV